MKKQLYLFVVAFICFVQSAQAQAYYNTITVTEPHNIAQTNFPVLVTVNTQALIAAGQMQANGADIRFAADTSCPVVATYLNYYIESGINTPTTRIWVRLPSLAAGATDALYMFYGDPLAAATSSFALTFPNAVIVTSGNNVTLTGTQNIGWLQVDAGGTLNVQTGAPLTIMAERVIINGTVMGNGMGHAGAPTNGTGFGPGAGSPASPAAAGAGGGSYGGVGGTGGLDAGDNPGVGGPLYGTPTGTDIAMGSGGGGATTVGGAGGGGVSIYSNDMTLTGIISMNGITPPNNASSGGGGGSGGGVLIRSQSLTGAGTVNAAGGNGSAGTSTANDGGGGGGGGRIKLFTANTPALTTNVAGGGGGAFGTAAPGQPGGAGTIHAGTVTFIAPVIGTQNPTSVTPDVTISVSPSNSICSGSTVTFTANVTNAGVGPVYQWFKNDVLQVAVGDTYIDNALANNDAIKCVIVTTGLCTTTPTDTSNVIIMSVTPTVTPTVTISVTPGDTVCDGTIVSYTAASTFGGTTPAYQWFKNGVVQPSLTNVSVDNAIADGDSISLVLISNEACVTSVTATSNDIIMAVTPNVTPDVTITVSPSSVICEGTIDTFTASTVNGGTAPVLQWFNNGVLLAVTDSVYINNSPQDGDSVFCVLTSSEVCVTDITDTSNSIIMTVMPTNTLAGAMGTTETHVVNISGTTQVNYTDCDVIATITPSGVSPINGNTSVGVTIDNTVNNYQGQPYVQRHYDIEPGNSVPAPTATITLYAYQSEFDAYNTAATPGNYPLLPTGGIDNGNVKITQYHGTGTAPGNYTGAPELIIPTVSWDAVNNWWELTFDVTDFSGFYIHTGMFDNPLAIQLKSIKAANLGSVNRVNWETASEDLGDVFTLERSADGKLFTAIATVAAKGTSSVYTYNDERPIAGVNYYRIKMSDAGDKTHYSKVVTARTDAAKVFTLQAYPNPANEQLTVSVSGNHSDNGVLAITDMMGRVVKEMSFTGNQMSIDVSNLAAGNYLIRYTDDVNTTTIKIGKQ